MELTAVNVDQSALVALNPIEQITSGNRVSDKLSSEFRSAELADAQYSSLATMTCDDCNAHFRNTVSTCASQVQTCYSNAGSDSVKQRIAPYSESWPTWNSTESIFFGYIFIGEGSGNEQKINNHTVGCFDNIRQWRDHILVQPNKAGGSDEFAYPWSHPQLGCR